MIPAGGHPRDDADRIIAASARVMLGSALDGATAFQALARAWETGGGSTVARRHALGRLALERSPGGEVAHVAAIARRLLGGRWPPALRVVAIDAERGERIVLEAATGVRPERAVAASRAVPVLLPPITVAGRRCIDGALGSATNADVLAGSAAARVIVITPVPADPPSGGPERLWLAALREEVATLEATGPPRDGRARLAAGAGGDGTGPAQRRYGPPGGGGRTRSWARTRASDQALARGVGRGGGPRGLAQLGADVGDVPVHRVR